MKVPWTVLKHIAHVSSGMNDPWWNLTDREYVIDTKTHSYVFLLTDNDKDHDFDLKEIIKL